MPITYAVDGQLGLIRETWTGHVGAGDLAEYWRDYLADPVVLALRRTLVDLRQCRIVFTGTELRALVDSMVVPVLQGRTWKTAIVVDNVVQFGVSRQYQAFADSYSSDSIFSDPDEALAWLLR